MMPKIHSTKRPSAKFIFGQSDELPINLTPVEAKKFWRDVRIREGACWEWFGYIERTGYGVVHFSGVAYRVHRVSWTLTNGPIPKGLTLDHLCRNRSCVNPAHLEPVTHVVNTMRGDGLPAQNARKTACSNGHPFTDELTKKKLERGRSRRICIVCRRIRNRKYQLRRRRRDKRIWDPIETAPKGAAVLLLADGVSVDVGWWTSDGWRLLHVADMKPTHWMPLPGGPGNTGDTEGPTP